jgi:hypothetical protein
MQAYHTLVTGDSGGGKTSLCRELHLKAPYISVWVNHTAERVPDGRSRADAKTVRSRKSLRQAVDSGHTAINFRTTDAHKAIQAARGVGWYQTDEPLQIIVDEASGVMPDGCDNDNPLKRCLHQDRDRGVRALVVTQDPSDLDYTPLKNVKYWAWCGAWSTFHDGFIRYFNIPRDELPDEPHAYTVFDKRMSVLYRGETQEAYA